MAALPFRVRRPCTSSPRHPGHSASCYDRSFARNLQQFLRHGGPHSSREAALLPRDFEETLRTILIQQLDLTPPLKVQRGASLREAIGLMQEKQRPCLIVCDGEKVAGIFTERDVLYKLAGEDADLDLPVDGVMTPDPRTLSPEDPVGSAIRMMMMKSHRHIPLTDGQGNCVGVVTARDIIVYIAENFPAEVFNLPPDLSQLPTKAEGG